MLLTSFIVIYFILCFFATIMICIESYFDVIGFYRYNLLRGIWSFIELSFLAVGVFVWYFILVILFWIHERFEE